MTTIEKAQRTTVYGVMTFVKKGARLSAEQPRVATSEANAKHMAETLARTRAGAIAFSRTGDKELGEFDDPIILAEHGTVPDPDGF